jgi:hypothetical protein
MDLLSYPQKAHCYNNVLQNIIAAGKTFEKSFNKAFRQRLD